MALVSSTWSFVKRHKGKFMIFSAGVGGLIYLNKVLSSVERNWEKSSSKDFVSEIRKKDTHYENSIRTCNQTCLTLSSKILDNLDVLLDSETILQQLHSSPVSIKLWDELKIIIFSRAASEVYSICLFVCYLRVQLLVIAGYIYVGSSLGTSLNHKIQLRYLSLLHSFYDEGMSKIVEPVKCAVKSILSDTKLDESLSAEDLQKIFDQIKERVSLEIKSNTSRFLMNPEQLQQMSDDTSPPISSGEAATLRKLMDETQDVLETDDFSQALNATVNVGFSHLMDIMLQCFLTDDDGNEDASSFSNPNCVRIPLAKLLPGMKKVLAGRQTLEEKQSLVREILCQDLLNCYSANVYEAFCEEKN